MKTTNKLLVLLLVACILLSSLISCKGNENNDPSGGENNLAPWVDYVSQVKLDMTSNTNKVEATVKSYIDGDTTHFYVKEYVDERVAQNGALKARYLAINTPESTGMIEEWGKAASRFTRSKLENAVSIILESDNDKWNIDSTGERHLVWVWYKTAENEEYRNLNIEILQAGYAISSNASQNRYGSVCTNTISQAIAYNLYVYSKELDPDFPYGEAEEVTLKQLRTHIEDYNGRLVAFNGIITMNSDGSVLVEDYDEENNMVYGMTVYFGTSGLSGAGQRILNIGNEARIVGVVSYWETGNEYQVSALKYDPYDKDNPRNIKLLSSGHEPTFIEVSAKTFTSKVDVMLEEETKTFDYAEITLNTSISMKNLHVDSVYTTQQGESMGAMTLKCTAEDGTKIEIRTTVLRYDDDPYKDVITADYFLGKTIDVKGFVGVFGEDYQIEVYLVKDVTIHP